MGLPKAYVSSSQKTRFVSIPTRQKESGRYLSNSLRSPNIKSKTMMTQLQTLQPIRITKPLSTCATCPYFQDFYDRDRGLCQVFDLVTKKPNRKTSDCDLQIESLLKQPKTCTLKVELITSEVEDDGSGHAVPVDSRTVEVTVAQPLRGLIKAEIATRKDLQGWQVADFWQPNPDGEFEI
jgi:hypothetical protein